MNTNCWLHCCSLVCRFVKDDCAHLLYKDRHPVTIRVVKGGLAGAVTFPQAARAPGWQHTLKAQPTPAGDT